MAKETQRKVTVVLNEEQRKQIQQKIGYVKGLSGLDENCQTTKVEIIVREVEGMVSVISRIIND